MAPATESGCATQVPSKPSRGLAPLVLAQLRLRLAVGLLVGAARDERRHPAHRVRAAAVAGLHEQLGVGAHERHRHRHAVAVGQQELAPVPEALDHREHVVPAAGVEAGRVLAQLVEDLVHLERGRHRLDQHGGPDRAALDPQLVLAVGEHVVPEPRLEVALHLRQVEVRTAALVEQPARVVEHVQAEVHERACRRLAVHAQVLLREMPAARAHQQRGHLVVQAVLAAVGARELDRALDRVGEVHVALDHVAPGRRVRVLEVRHEAARARVERVDHHLALGRAGDLHAPVLQVGRRRGHAPVALAHRGRLLEEVELRAGLELGHALRAPAQQVAARASEAALQPLHEGQRVVGQHLCHAALDGRVHLHQLPPCIDM